jgi:hypothetical protein
MPAGERAVYATHVLSPLKALVADLAAQLRDVRPPLGLEARVGASLFWPDGARGNPEDCPVRRIRIWDADTDPDRSPVLHTTFTADGIEVGLSAGGRDAPVSAADRAALESAGWTVRSDEGVEVSRRLPWDEWLDDPDLGRELADRFRELLPLFDELRRSPSVARRDAAPGGAPAAGAR